MPPVIRPHWVLGPCPVGGMGVVCCICSCPCGSHLLKWRGVPMSKTDHLAAPSIPCEWLLPHALCHRHFGGNSHACVALDNIPRKRGRTTSRRWSPYAEKTC